MRYRNFGARFAIHVFYHNELVTGPIDATLCHLCRTETRQLCCLQLTLLLHCICDAHHPHYAKAVDIYGFHCHMVLSGKMAADCIHYLCPLPRVLNIEPPKHPLLGVYSRASYDQTRTSTIFSCIRERHHQQSLRQWHLYLRVCRISPKSRLY